MRSAADLAVLGKVCDFKRLSANSLRGLCNLTHVRPMAGRRHYVQGSGLKVLCPCVRGLQTSGRQGSGRATSRGGIELHACERERVSKCRSRRVTRRKTMKKNG